MKYLLPTITLLFLSVGLNAQQQVDKKTAQEIVINYEMINKFHAAEFSESNMDLVQIFSKYDFNDARLILQGYKQNRLELDSTNISIYLADVKQKMQKEINLASIDKQPILAEQKIKTSMD